MQKSTNSFKDLEAIWEAGLPPELETRVSGHASNLSVFGRVVELFMPDALQTAVRMIGGNPEPPATNLIPGRRPAPEEWPDWRTPPGRGGAPGPDR